MSLRICSYLLKPFTSNVRCLSFKSGISLDKIYPESVEVKPIELSVSKDGKFNGYIPINELQVSYVRSSGAGGQHVQKLNTKCDLRFNVDQVTFISEETKKKMKTKFATRINKKGEFVIKSEKTRYQYLNLADAMTYLREIIYNLEEPEPTLSKETQEKIRKNLEKANRIRLMEKRHKAYIKSFRGE